MNGKSNVWRLYPNGATPDRITWAMRCAIKGIWIADNKDDTNELHAYGVLLVALGEALQRNAKERKEKRPTP